MESIGIFKKNLLKISHLPTVCLLIGYAVYWLELYFFNTSRGQTSLLALSLSIIAVIFVIFRQKKHVSSEYGLLKNFWQKNDKLTRTLLITGLTFIFFILGIVFYASLLPPHLGQEFDALNYHLTVSRQHLILGSFSHIEWSSADLFSLPLDFALAPYWFVTKLPNKLPQFFFLIGLVLVVINITKRFSCNNLNSMLAVVFAVFGSHFIGIQMGTAMLDIVMCYLFIAFLDSFLRKDFFMAACELSFFFWSKSFIPFQMVAIALSMILLFIVFKKAGFKNIAWRFTDVLTAGEKTSYVKCLRKMLVLFVLLSIFIGAPFMTKSLYCSGTPLFPFFVGAFPVGFGIDDDMAIKDSVLASASMHISTKEAYGYGKNPLDFIKHFWLIAVPDKGVNNKYDYPVGLPYLILIGPFLCMLFYSVKNKYFPIIPLFIIIYWLSWWFGSQQTRFLYLPVVLIFIVVVSQKTVQTRMLMGIMVLSLCFTGISIFRAHKNDLGLSAGEVLRQKDKKLIEMSRRYSMDKKADPVYLDFYDAAYAQFPVIVKKGDPRWILSER